MAGRQEFCILPGVSTDGRAVSLEEAGGGLCDGARRPLRYNARHTLINPDFLAFGDAGHDWTRYLPRRSPPA